MDEQVLRRRVRASVLVAASRLWLVSGLVVLLLALPTVAHSAPRLAPSVELEEQVYNFDPANNGAGPLWCSGSTCLVRSGADLFASGLETIKDAKPLNNCRWLLFQRGAEGWQLRQADASGRTREPSPLAAFPDGRVFLSANPTLAAPDAYSGLAQPEMLQFSARDPQAAPERLLPAWDGKPAFTEHSYRSLAADGPAGELILFQNVGYTHAEWTFRDRDGHWAAQGKLPWPRGSDYPKPEPIRVCYPDVALRNRAVHFCGVSDILEPYPEWRAFKRQLTGQDWDYDFRRLFYTWTPDITREKFRPWVELASRDKTCGWISPGDLWAAPDGAVHVVWTERALDERLRAKFFPDAKQSRSLNYAVLRDGKVALSRTLLSAEEGRAKEIASSPRFHVTPDQRLFVVFCATGTDRAGQAVSEDRLLEILPVGRIAAAVKVRFRKPFTSFFTATVRAGSPSSDPVELLGERAGEPGAISYARVNLNLARH